MPARPRLSVVAVGDELLRGDVIDTNGPRLAVWALEAGLDPGPRCVVGDDEAAIARAVRALLAEADVVAVLGGLGPTADDVTREGVARALGRPLERREDLARSLAELYARRGYALSDAVLRQAELPRGATPLANPVGTAPGFWIETDPRHASDRGRLVIVAPGPPRELIPMGPAIMALLRDRFPEAVPPPSRRLHVAGYGESVIAEKVAAALGAASARPGSRPAPRYASAGVRYATYLHAGAVEVRLWADPGQDDALASAADAVEAALAPRVYSRDEPGLAPAVARAARERGITVATAESCTAGLVGAALASVPGASEWYLGGVVAYTEGVKAHLLAVDAGLLAREGAVSAACAEAMAEGARLATGAGLAVSVTCYAGPAGGDARNPLGTTYLGWSDASGGHGFWRRVYHGPRDSIRERAAWEALVLLWSRLQGVDLNT